MSLKSISRYLVKNFLIVPLILTQIAFPALTWANQTKSLENLIEITSQNIPQTVQISNRNFTLDYNGINSNDPETKNKVLYAALVRTAVNEIGINTLKEQKQDLEDTIDRALKSESWDIAKCAGLGEIDSKNIATTIFNLLLGNIELGEVVSGVVENLTDLKTRALAIPPKIVIREKNNPRLYLRAYVGNQANARAQYLESAITMAEKGILTYSSAKAVAKYLSASEPYVEPLSDLLNSVNDSTDPRWDVLENTGIIENITMESTQEVQNTLITVIRESGEFQIYEREVTRGKRFWNDIEKIDSPETNPEKILHWLLEGIELSGKLRIVFSSSPKAKYEPSLYLILPDGRGLTRLTQRTGDEFPSRSPSGKEIVFSSKRETSRSQLYTISFGGEVHPLNIEGYDPSYGPNGIIAYASNIDGRPQIFVTDKKGECTRRLTNSEFSDRSPEFHPNGVLIYFVRSFGNNDTGIFVYDLVNGRERSLIDVQGYRELDPTCSPNGTKLAYTFFDRSHYICMVDTSGKNLEVNLAEGRHPSWSPDGRKIVFSSDSGRYGNTALNQELYIVDINTRKITRLTNNPKMSNESPDWN